MTTEQAEKQAAEMRQRAEDMCDDVADDMREMATYLDDAVRSLRAGQVYSVDDIESGINAAEGACGPPPVHVMIEQLEEAAQLYRDADYLEFGDEDE